VRGGLRPNPNVSARFALVTAFIFIGSAVVGFPPSASAAGAPPLDQQLAARGIHDPRVLEAFRRVRRDAFVPNGASEREFDDQPLHVGYGQTISQPLLVARMAELLELKPESRVLAIGTGSGYQAAILAELAREVFTVEVIPELATTARLRLTREGYQNVHVRLGEGSQGWREYAPYDAVVVTAVMPRVPSDVVEQLSDGGVLVMAVGPARGRQVLIRGVKKGLALHAHEIAELRPAPSGAVDDERRVREGQAPRRPDESRSDR